LPPFNQGLTGDLVGGAAGEERDGVGDVGRLPHPIKGVGILDNLIVVPFDDVFGGLW
jgi:hypothetical protein